jgi:hypothetical protein
MKELVEYTDRDREAGTVERVVVRETADGYDYAMHYGTLDGETLLRYDNAHGVHERHEGDDVVEIAFPGIDPLLRQFYREIENIDP